METISYNVRYSEIKFKIIRVSFIQVDRYCIHKVIYGNWIKIHFQMLRQVCEQIG